MFWSLLQNVGGSGITFVVTIVLARLLTPEVFGLIGMLMIFIQVSQTLVYAGFNQALIQKKEADEEDYSSIFWINLAVSLVLYGVLFFTAPLISDFYHQPVLTELTRALSLVFVINAFSYVQETRITKEMRFRTLTIIHIPSTILGGIVSIIMAVKGYGVWSIIALQLVTRFAYSVQIWMYAKWKPLFTFNKTKAKGLFAYGSKLMLSQILGTVFRNIYLVVIGKFFSLASVGYYQNANNLVQYPTSTFTSALAKVTFPAFSTIQDDNRKLRDGYKRIIQQLLFWLCPLFVLAGVLAVPLFRFIFTVKWLPSVPYFRLLCVIGVFWPLNVYSLNIINVKGRSDITLRLDIVKKLIIIISLAAAISFGIWMVIIVQVVNTIFSFFLNSHYSGKFIKYSVREQVKDILPIFLLSIFTGAIVFFADLALVDLPDIIRLLLGTCLGIAVYWAAAKTKRLKPYLDCLEIYRTTLKGRSR